jgi:uncharacterized OB-fold protein
VTIIRNGKVRGPMPQPDEITQPFWDAARCERLVIMRCDDCGTYTHPPLPQCGKCASPRMTWQPVSGKGTVYGHTVVREARVPGLEGPQAIGCTAVELVEQPRLLVFANILDAEPGEVKIGEKVAVAFEEVGEFVLPQFVRAGGRP